MRSPRAPSAVHEVPAGPVPSISAELLERVAVPTPGRARRRPGDRLAKAIAAVRGGRVCAIPTTLSGAPMTTIHRLPEGAAGAAA